MPRGVVPLLASAFVWFAVGACGSDDRHRSHHPLPFKADNGYLQVLDGSTYKPIFLKGWNLGVGLPGTNAGELAASSEQYHRWFRRMGESGANAIRLYTLHYPRMFQALDAYNKAHRDKPMYILHGIWLDEENPTLDLYDMTEHYDDNIRETTDVVHGERFIPERRGRAHGEYTHDIADFIIGWVIGREVFPDEVSTTNRNHPDKTSFHGKYVHLAQGTPTEVWWAERMEKLLSYEKEKYGVQRPVSVSSWPTLDPLHHPTEAYYPGSEDSEQMDFTKLDTTHMPAGYFGTYHAYPYYPDFMSEQPNYTEVSDADGPNSYLGYLRDLRAKYFPKPLLVGEVGVPSSWGNAHYAHSGMSHGGQDETEQSEQNARLVRNAWEAPAAGAMMFAWIDEWWKRTWIVDELSMPRSNYKLWHNVTSPEQNFGAVAFDIGEPKFEMAPIAGGTGRISAVHTDADAEFFHVRLTLTQALLPGEELVVGFDTYADDRGEIVLPNQVKTTRRNEFALVVKSPDSARFHVTNAYDQVGVWHARLASGEGTDGDRLYRSTATEGAPWNLVRWKNSGDHGSSDGKYRFPEAFQDIGVLRIRDASQPKTSRDAVVLDGTTITLRVPWTLLHVTDPTTHLVLDDNRDTRERETVTTEGIALAVSLGTELVETPRYLWPGWDTTPRFKEREKPTMQGLAEIFRSLPDAPP